MTNQVSARPIKLIAGFLGILILVAVLASMTGTRLSSSGATATPNTSDATIKAEMSRNLTDVRESYREIKFDGAAPDIAVTDGVLIVATYLDPADAAGGARLCRAVAAHSNSGDTGAPLGVKSVAIISGGTKVADCRP